tara:strand:- start:1966 stop:2724 length:759 start_codon:yes stop_codon:yes gene_type:complete
MDINKNLLPEIGVDVLHYDRVQSTMDIAWEHFDSGKGHGLVVLAKEQTQGRGRFARRWHTGYNETMSMSVILQPPLEQLPLIPIAANLAIADTINSITGLSCVYKWPNDVLVTNRKISGVLLESRVTPEGHCSAVLGIGANVNIQIDQHPDLIGIATSVSELLRHQTNIDIFETNVIKNLQKRYTESASNPTATLAQWSSKLATLGQTINVRLTSGTITGTAESVDNRGRLLLRLPSGAIKLLQEGEVTLST